jgi:general secretion pathway protein G
MRSTKGFSLVELLIVVMIIGALAAIAIPRIGTSAATAKANTCATNVDLINSQIELYMANEGAWPTALTDVTTNTDYFPDGAPTCPFGDAYVYSTTTYRVAAHSH